LSLFDMKLEIQFGEDTPRKNINFLKDQLSAIPDVEKVDFARDAPDPGNLGVFTATLVAVLSSKAVSHLIDVLKEAEKGSKTKILIKNGKKEVLVESKHPEKLTAFITEIQKNME